MLTCCHDKRTTTEKFIRNLNIDYKVSYWLKTIILLLWLHLTHNSIDWKFWWTINKLNWALLLGSFEPHVGQPEQMENLLKLNSTILCYLPISQRATNTPRVANKENTTISVILTNFPCERLSLATGYWRLLLDTRTKLWTKTCDTSSDTQPLIQHWKLISGEKNY